MKSHAVVELGRDRLRLRVGEDPDRSAAPVGEPKRGTPVSAAAAKGRRGRVLLGCAGAYPNASAGPRRERKGKEASGPRGGEKEMGRARDREGGEEIFFLFIFPAFSQTF